MNALFPMPASARRRRGGRRPAVMARPTRPALRAGLLALALGACAGLARGGDLDWPDRPRSAPYGGFFIQDRNGKQGDFAVVVPWPSGGLALFTRDNDQPGTDWLGPVLFGDGKYSGASVVEGGDAVHNENKVRNLEVIAIDEFGGVEHWTRENGGNFTWSLTNVLGADATGVPSITYTGAQFNDGLGGFSLKSHGPNSLFVAYARKDGGFDYWQRWNDADPNLFPDVPFPFWYRLGTPGIGMSAPPPPADQRLTGVAIALTVIDGEGYPYVDWKAAYSPHTFLGSVGPAGIPVDGGNSQLLAAVTASGSLVILHGSTVWEQHTTADDRSTHSSPSYQVWGEPVLPSVPDGGSQRSDVFWGNACLIHGDYGFDEPTVQINAVLQPRHYGNLELMVPKKSGGILALFRDNGDSNNARDWKAGWAYAGLVGSRPYDQISCVQTNLGNAKHGQLHMVARWVDQAGFDYYWRDDDLQWHGPESVGAPEYGSVTHPYGPGIGVLHQPLGAASSPTRPAGAPSDTPQQMLAGLARANVDFSRPAAIADLEAWLANPLYTPYPALTRVLLTLLGPRRFLKPVQIDVIAYDYEPDQKATRPRLVSDVDIERLKKAVLAAANERAGTHETDFWKLLGP